MAFLEDPRLRQRWNQFSQTTEAVTENAAAGIWRFGHNHVTPCLASLGLALDGCTAVCLGDREERARRARERERARGNAEYSFDFYDDWDEDLADPHGGGLLGGWRNEDWDRLLAGTARGRKGGGEVVDQPRGIQGGMSYGTRGVKRKAAGAEDPTVIPSTQPLGFLGRLPFKIGGTLRYKPSAANLKEHPGGTRHEPEGEREPLLGHEDGEYRFEHSPLPIRTRSGTTGSGDTSDSYRSRGDLFSSDGEGDEDAVPLDDEFAVALVRADDQSSSRTKSSKGKRKLGSKPGRSGSRTTLNSTQTRLSLKQSSSIIPSPRATQTPERDFSCLEELQREEQLLGQAEDEEVYRKREAAFQLAQDRGLGGGRNRPGAKPEVKSEVVEVSDAPGPTEHLTPGHIADDGQPKSASCASDPVSPDAHTNPSTTTEGDFVPARLPHFR